MKINAFHLKSLPIAFSVAIGAMALNSAAQQPAAHSMQEEDRCRTLMPMLLRSIVCMRSA